MKASKCPQQSTLVISLYTIIIILLSVLVALMIFQSKEMQRTNEILYNTYIEQAQNNLSRIDGGNILETNNVEDESFLDLDTPRVLIRDGKEALYINNGKETLILEGGYDELLLDMVLPENIILSPNGKFALIELLYSKGGSFMVYDIVNEKLYELESEDFNVYGLIYDWSDDSRIVIQGDCLAYSSCGIFESTSIEKPWQVEHLQGTEAYELYNSIYYRTNGKTVLVAMAVYRESGELEYRRFSNARLSNDGKFIYFEQSGVEADQELVYNIETEETKIVK